MGLRGVCESRARRGIERRAPRFPGKNPSLNVTPPFGPGNVVAPAPGQLR